jgi:hypothetical protein
MGDTEKLLARMKASQSGWNQNDLDALYKGFGFEVRNGAKHQFYYHPSHRELYATVARHSTLAKGYVFTAIRLIERLKYLETQDDDK